MKVEGDGAGRAVRVNARLDPEHGRRLAYLRRVFGASTTEIIRRALDALYAETTNERGPVTRAVLDAHGFIGCAESESTLSTDYKRELQRSLDDKA